MAENRDHGPIIQGFLKKKKINSWSWKERWCCLYPTQLLFYKRRYDLDPIHSISLNNITAIKNAADVPNHGIDEEQVARAIVIELGAPAIVMLWETQDGAHHWMSLVESAWEKSVADLKAVKMDPEKLAQVQGYKPIRLDGTMSKRTFTSWRWRSRFFVLDGFTLTYYKDSTKDELVGSIIFDETVKLREKPQRFPGITKEELDRCFAIICASKDTCFLASSTDQKNVWIQAISDVLRNLRLTYGQQSAQSTSMTLLSQTSADLLSSNTPRDDNPWELPIERPSSSKHRHSLALDLSRKSLSSTASIEDIQEFANLSKDDPRANQVFLVSKSTNKKGWKPKMMVIQPRDLAYYKPHMNVDKEDMKKIPLDLITRIQKGTDAKDELPEDLREPDHGRCIILSNSSAKMYLLALTEEIAIRFYEELLVARMRRERSLSKTTSIRRRSMTTTSSPKVSGLATFMEYTSPDATTQPPSIMEEVDVNQTSEVILENTSNLPALSSIRQSPTFQSSNSERKSLSEEIFPMMLGQTMASNPSSDKLASLSDSDQMDGRASPMISNERIPIKSGALRLLSGDEVDKQHGAHYDLFHIRRGETLWTELFCGQGDSAHQVFSTCKMIQATESGTSKTSFIVKVENLSLEFEVESGSERTSWISSLHNFTKPIPKLSPINTSFSPPLSPHGSLLGMSISPRGSRFHPNSISPQLGSRRVGQSDAKFAESTSMPSPSHISKAFLSRTTRNGMFGTLCKNMRYMEDSFSCYSSHQPKDGWKVFWVILQGMTMLFLKNKKDVDPHRSVILRRVANVSICSVPSDLAVNRSSNIFQFDVEGELFYFMHENIETIRSWIEALQYEPTTTIARAVLPSPLLKFFTINDIMTSNKEETTIDKPDSKLHASLAQVSAIDGTQRGSVQITAPHLTASSKGDVKSESSGKIQGELRSLGSFLPALVIKRFSGDPAILQEPIRDSFQAAVIFADISGFTPLSERLCKKGGEGAEKLSSYLNRYFEQLIALLKFFGGDIIKFAGDALLAMWSNGPLRLNTLWAVQCALEMQQKLHGWRAGDDGELRLHVGIGAGQVTAVHVGGKNRQWEFFIIGPALAQISNAESNAKVGEVVVSKEAWHQIRENCVGAPVGNEGCHRVDKVLNPLPPRILSVPVITPVMEGALRSYLMPVVNSRLSSGQSLWLAEIRKVSILFMRIPIFNQEESDQFVFNSIQKAMLIIQSRIFHWGGAIRQFMMDDKGSVLVAVFGLPPESSENYSARCIRAALDLQSAFHEELYISCSIGITSGTAFCGAVGSNDRREYAVVGDVVNLAARFMVAAKHTLAENGLGLLKNSIICDEPTYNSSVHVELRNQRIRFRPLPSIKVKGKTDTIPIYYPIEVIDMKEPMDQADMIIVGRDKARSRLLHLLKSIASGQGGGVVFLTGDAGMGKSCLSQELKYLAKSHFVRIFYGVADRIERCNPLFPWKSILYELLSLSSSTQMDSKQYSNAVIDKLRSLDRRQSLRVEQDRSSRTFEQLAPLLNAILPKLDLPDSALTTDMSGEVRAENTIALIVQIFLQLPKDPAVIIIDNVQWFDSASWELVQELASKLPHFLIVLAGRPLNAEKHPRYEQMLLMQGVEEIQLGAMLPEESTSLICKVFNITKLPESLSDSLAQRGQGNPFFLIEIMRRLISSQVLLVENGFCRVSPNLQLSAIPFPDSIQTIIQSYIDDLPVGPQLTLKVASVIGATFTLEALKAIHPIAADKIDWESEIKLLSVDLIHRVAQDADTTEGNTYCFKHLLTQDIAYNLLLVEQRKKLHAAVASFFETKFASELHAYYATLSHHFLKAENYRKTVEYMDLAGKLALESNDNKEALDFFSKARTLAEQHQLKLDPVILCEICRFEGEALFRMGDMATSRARFEQSLTALGLQVPVGKYSVSFFCGLMESKSLPERNPVSMNIAMIYSAFNKTNRRFSVAQTPVAFSIYERLSEVYFNTNERGRMIDSVVQAYFEAMTLGGPDERTRVYAMISLVACMHGHRQMADEYISMAKEKLKYSTPQTAVIIMKAISYCGLSVGGTSALFDATAMLTEAMEIASEIHDRRNWRECMHLFAVSEYLKGNYVLSIASGKQLVDAARRSEDMQAVWWGLTAQVRSLLILNEVEDAMRLLMEGIGVLQKHKIADPAIKVESHGLLSLTRLRRGFSYVQVALETAELMIADIPFDHVYNQPYLFVALSCVAEVLYLCIRSPGPGSGSSNSLLSLSNSNSTATTNSPLFSESNLAPFCVGVAEEICMSDARLSANTSQTTGMKKEDRPNSNPTGASSKSHRGDATKKTARGLMDERISRSLASDRKRLEKLLRQVCDLLNKYAQAFPVGLPRATLWQGLLEQQIGNSKQAVKTWAKCAREADVISLPWERAQALLLLANTSSDANEKMKLLSKAQAIFLKQNWMWSFAGNPLSSSMSRSTSPPTQTNSLS
eukprot:TRINITY_DN7555_c0_g1_i1.p1 TRINITY_DN7555_c0_g1~~TRINITY_DN7555_c0_g1_i1.p1  ORF type:complete len:2453 (-),score=413.18 TRINITY_DN7555_c0_g1_i1:295-7653(-)